MSKSSALRHFLLERRAQARDLWSQYEAAARDASWLDELLPKKQHPATSEAAHEAVRPKMGKDRGRILACLRDVWPNGLTRPELAERLRIPVNTVNGRVSELRAAKDVYVSGVRDRCGIVIARMAERWP